MYLFDEWSADQDPAFKRLFYLELLPELKVHGKTVVVISHDDHFYHVADRIIKLDEGRIEYNGRPDRVQRQCRRASLPAGSWPGTARLTR